MENTQYCNNGKPYNHGNRGVVRSHIISVYSWKCIILQVYTNDCNRLQGAKYVDALPYGRY